MSQSVSIGDLDAVSASEVPFEFEVISPKTGKPMGIFISVIGDQSEKVKALSRREVNRQRMAEASKPHDPAVKISTIEEDEAFSIETCVLRTVNWRGITEECTPDNARRLYKVNPQIRAQVLRHSTDIGNFLKL